MTARFLLPLATALLLPLAADGPQPGRRADQEALKPFAGLVGEWRGTGQPQRGSAKGAWTETATWAWKLTPDSAALELTVAKGKFLHSATLRPGKGKNAFILEAVLADGSKRTFAGTLAEKKPLALAAEPPDGDGPRRVVLTPLHDTRFLLLFEGRGDEGAGARRLAEVGYTRQGVAFAAGESYPTCIVTEGRGTTQVSYKGKTYWVCCSGCKDLFQEDPEAVLAEAAARQKAKEKGAAK
jgi:YHS domain-containing protein